MKSPATEIQPEAWTGEQVCCAAQISYDTFQNLRRRGEGPPEVKIGTTVRYLRTDTMEWLESLRTAGARPGPRPEPKLPPGDPVPAMKAPQARKPTWTPADVDTGGPRRAG